MIETDALAWVEDDVLILAKWCCGIPWPIDIWDGDWTPGVIAGFC